MVTQSTGAVVGATEFITVVKMGDKQKQGGVTHGAALTQVLSSWNSKPQVFHVPTFYGSIIAASQNGLSVRRKAAGFHRSRICVHNLQKAACGCRPQPQSTVTGGADDRQATRGDGTRPHFLAMPVESMEKLPRGGAPQFHRGVI